MPIVYLFIVQAEGAGRSIGHPEVEGPRDGENIFGKSFLSCRLRPVQRHIRRPRLNSQGHSSCPTPHLIHWMPHLAGPQVLLPPPLAPPSVAQVRGSLSSEWARGAICWLSASHHSLCSSGQRDDLIASILSGKGHSLIWGGATWRASTPPILVMPRPPHLLPCLLCLLPTPLPFRGEPYPSRGAPKPQVYGEAPEPTGSRPEGAA